MSKLSKREQEVLNLLATGASNQEIGEALNISPLTVKTHAQRIYRKLDVPNRTTAAVYALKEQDGLR